MDKMVSEDQKKRIYDILAEDGDTPKSTKVKVKNKYLFGRLLYKTEVTFLDGRDKWIKG